MAGQTSEVIIRLKGDASGAARALDKTQRGLRGVRQEGQKAAKVGTQFGAALKYMLTPMVNFATGLRQISQGFQSLAYLISTFISLPLTLAFRAGAKTAIAYDDALIRVKKTTELTEQQLGRLNKRSGTLNARLQNLAKTIATPLVQLAELAERAGQLGVRGVDNLMAYVRVAEIIGKTTDIEADEALSAFGRLARGMGVKAGQAGDFIVKLATTVNELENTTTASASTIVDAMQNMISAASGLGQEAAPSVVAFAATLYDLGVPARVAGTMYNRMAQYVASNTEKIASLLGTTVQEVRRQFDEDFTGSLVNFMQALSEVESRTARMQIAQEIFGKRAGRGVTLLSENLDELIKNLETAREEFHHGDSLIREYNEAMKSTQSQLGILRNNLQVAAATLGQTFLPIINKVVAWTVPAIQKLVEIFTALPKRVQLGAAAILALSAVVGPLLVIISTLGFSLGMIVSGIANVVVAVTSMAGSLSGLLPIIATVGAALLGLGQFAERGVSRIGDVFLDAADAAEGWGLGIVSSLAAGMLRGIAAVVNAAVQIANAIAGFFAASSPPEKGPLRKITVWGKKLIQSYLKGFASADFDVIEDVTNKIADYFRGLAGAGMFDEKKVIPAILEVRHAFTELLHIFDETGRVSDEILNDIKNRMGEAGERVARYLKLYLKVNAAQKKYNEASERLEEIARLRDEITATYEDEVEAIESSGKPVLEQMRMVGRARRDRDNNLDMLSDEEALQRDVRDAAQEKLDQQQELLDTQEGLIDYYQTELDLLAEQKEAAKGAAGAAAGAAGELDEFAGALAGVEPPDIKDWWDEVASTLKDLLGGIQTIPEEMRKAKKAIDAFFAGLAGEPIEVEAPFDMGPLEQVDKEQIQAYQIGSRIGGIFEGLKTAIENLTKPLEELTSDDTGLGWFTTGDGRGLAPTLRTIGISFLTWKIIMKVGGWVLAAQEAIAGLGGLEGVLAPIAGAFTGLSGAAFGFAFTAGVVFMVWQQNIGGFRDTMIKTFDDIKEAVVSFPDSMKLAWNNAKAYTNSLRIDVAFQLWKLKDDAMTTFGNLKRDATAVWESFKEDVLQPLREMALGLLEDWNEMTDGMLEGFQALWEDIKGPANDLKEFMVDDVFGPIGDAIDGVKKAVDTVKTAIGKLAEKARNLKLPDWMIPGSPPPLEIGLRGIADALAGVNVQMGDFELPKGVPVARGGYAFAGAGGTINGPLVEIDRIIVPNMQIGRHVAKQIADELGTLTRTRRTSA